MRPLFLLFVVLAASTSSHAGPLHDAVRACDLDLTRQLLAASPDLNEMDDNGLRPLHIAVDHLQIPCLDLLLKAGADREARDKRGRTAFDAAEAVTDKQERARLRRYLYLGSDNPLQQPLQTEEIASVGPMPWSLEYAALRGQTRALQARLKLGADPNEMGTRGTTPLADAALKGHLEAVQLLLSAGAKPDAVSQDGLQPIHAAALGGSADVIRELVERGADVNAVTQDESGDTPLHIATAMRRTAAVEALIALGSNTAARNSDGKSAMDIAHQDGQSDIADLIRRALSGN